MKKTYPLSQEEMRSEQPAPVGASPLLLRPPLKGGVNLEMRLWCCSEVF
jgi:hypothetical protein